MKYTDIPESVREKMQIDTLIFGEAFCLKKCDTYERIDPMRVVLHSDGTYKIINGETFSNRTTENMWLRLTAFTQTLLRKASHILQRCVKLVGLNAK